MVQIRRTELVNQDCPTRGREDKQNIITIVREPQFGHTHKLRIVTVAFYGFDKSLYGAQTKRPKIKRPTGQNVPGI